MLFACALNAVFELPPIVRELFGHFEAPPGTLRLIARRTYTVSPTPNLCDGIGCLIGGPGPRALGLTLEARPAASCGSPDPPLSLTGRDLPRRTGSTYALVGLVV